MAEYRRQVGFLPSLSKLTIGSLLWPEGVGGLVFGGGGAIALIQVSSLKARLEVAADALVVLAPLLGVVLAGLTLVIAVSSDDYLRLLARTKKDPLAFYRPFIIAIGVEIWTMLLIIGYRAVAEDMPNTWENWGFGIVCFFIVFALLDILAIARNVLMHTLIRSKAIKMDQSH